MKITVKQLRRIIKEEVSNAHIESNIEDWAEENKQEIEKFFGHVEDSKDICSLANLSIQNNVVSIKATDMGIYNAGYNPGF